MQEQQPEAGNPLFPGARAPKDLPFEKVRDPDELAVAPVDVAPAKPARWLAPLLFLFSPHRYWRHYAEAGRPYLTVLAAWTVGIVASMDRAESSALTMRNGGGIEWFMYWPLVIFFGALGGLLRYWIGGWWYKMRLKFSGVSMPDSGLARHVYVMAGQIAAIPMIIVMIYFTFVFDSPTDVIMTNTAITLLAVLPFWGAIVSYSGARYAFNAKQGPALVWFLILPWALFTFALGVFFALLAMVMPGVPADLSSVNEHNDGAIRLTYPGNWDVDESYGYDADTNVTIAPWMQDAYYTVVIHETGRRPLQIMEETISIFTNEAPRPRLTDPDPATYIGPYLGTSQTVRVQSMRDIEIFSCFVHQLEPGRVLEIRRSHLKTQSRSVQPGFDLIDRTLVFIR